MQKAFFCTLALIALVLIVISAIFDGAKMKDRQQYQADNDAILNGKQDTVQGAVYYNRLPSSEQYLYNQIRDAAKEFEEKTERMPFVPTEEQLDNALEALLLDDPGLFYLDKDNFTLEDIIYYETVEESENTDDDTSPAQTAEAEVIQQVEDKKFTTLQLSYIKPADELKVMLARFDAALKKADLFVEGLDSEYDKAVKLHDYLTEICKKGTGEYSDGAYGGLVAGVADSFGYAVSYKYLSDRCGMVSYVANGSYNGQNSYWNVTLIDGKYYNIDVFSDDLDGVVNGESMPEVKTHAYFCIDNTEFAKTHTVAEGQNLPECSDNTNYYKKYGVVCVNENTFYDVVEKQLEKTKKNREFLFELCVTHTDSADKIKDSINEIIKDVCPDYATHCEVYKPFGSQDAYIVHLLYIPPETLSLDTAMPETGEVTENAD